MDIPYERKKIGVFIAENGFVSIFEQVAGAAVFAVEVLGVPGEELPHDRGDALFAAPEQDMDMIAHEHPGVYRARCFLDGHAKPIKKPGFIFVISEYSGFVDPSHHDVVQGSGDIQAGLARHGTSLQKDKFLVKQFDTEDTTSPKFV
jgi:hypothetical protein